MTLPSDQNLPRARGDEAVPSNSFRCSALEKEGEVGLGVLRNLEIGRRWCYEIGGDLAVDRNKIGFLVALLWLRKEVLDCLQGGKEDILQGNDTLAGGFPNRYGHCKAHSLAHDVRCYSTVRTMTLAQTYDGYLGIAGVVFRQTIVAKVT